MNPYILDIDYTNPTIHINTNFVGPKYGWNSDDESPIIEHYWQLIDKRVSEQLPPETVNRVDPDGPFDTWFCSGPAGNNLSTEVEVFDEAFMEIYC
ncbi:hypothetical protein H2200_005257 [Cladophialophora chaetospira]|uniref:Uncharacterized protein n=1 Tax=Cladophialophora chaetospira TaxID=386627 RepID=A0AA38XBL9_9EURO|nr:hypothetical protein H2200_005257 [Cladophialophora chaetospira]